MWKQFLKDYFSFSKKERTAAMVLLGLIAFVYFLPMMIPVKNTLPDDKKIVDSLQQQIAALMKIDSLENEPLRIYEHNHPNTGGIGKNRTIEKPVLYYFDPNTLSAEGWKKLGIREKTIVTIQKYVSKGGRFRQAEDLKKVYGLYNDQYEQLLPYVKIVTTRIIHEKESDSNLIVKNIHPYFRKTYPATPIDINTVDTSELITLPGIGIKLALRIVSFREKLGGFYSILQLAEVYGLPDSTFKNLQAHLQCSHLNFRQMNINTADANTLKQHPYIGWNIANAIVQYRSQHGNYKSVNELLQIKTISEEVFQKMMPYLEIQ